MERNKKDVIQKNDSFPWKISDHSLGLRSEIESDRMYGHYKPTYHENIVTAGSSYRFHSPYELPFHKTKEHISEMDVTTQFFITPQISYLSESLMNDSIERWKDFSEIFGMY